MYVASFGRDVSARNTGSAATRTFIAIHCESGGLGPGSQYGERSDPYFHRPQTWMGV